MKVNFPDAAKIQSALNHTPDAWDVIDYLLSKSKNVLSIMVIYIALMQSMNYWLISSNLLNHSWIWWRGMLVIYMVGVVFVMISILISKDEISAAAWCSTLVTAIIWFIGIIFTLLYTFVTSGTSLLASDVWIGAFEEIQYLILCFWTFGIMITCQNVLLSCM